MLRFSCISATKHIPYLGFHGLICRQSRKVVRWVQTTSPGSSSSSSSAEPLISEDINGRKRFYYSRDAPTDLSTEKTSLSLHWVWDHPYPSFTSTDSIKTTSATKSKSYNPNQLLFQNTRQFVRGWLRSMFLPINYPHSVHRCYLKFHSWQATETYVGAVVGVLCNQAMLESLGLSTAGATAGAIAIQWVLKDGIAEVGKLLFIKRFARSFDSHPKSWKAVGEVLTTVGSGLQLCTLLFPPENFLWLAATGNIAKSTSWALWGATHMCFIRNFGLSNNVGDLTAKSDAQGAAAMIAGWLSGIALISISHSSLFLFSCYFALAPLHVLATWNLLKWAEFEILNESKSTLIMKSFVEKGHVPTMQELRPFEKFFGEFIDRSKVSVPEIKLGATVDTAFDNTDVLKRVIKAIPAENYLLGIRGKQICIILHREAIGRDVLKGLLHAMKFHHSLSEMKDLKDWNPAQSVVMSNLRSSHQWTHSQFPAFIAKLDSLDWESESLLFSDAGHRATWKKAERPDGKDIPDDILPPAIIASNQ